MDRRSFLFSATAACAVFGQTPANKLLKPKALAPGDTVALITPSTFVTDPDLIERVLRTIDYFGLKAKLGRNVRKKWGYAGGTITERVDDLHAAFADPEVKGVFCMRGGYAAGHLLADIDYELIRRNPKIFIGYSDITVLHACWRHLLVLHAGWRHLLVLHARRRHLLVLGRRQTRLLIRRRHKRVWTLLRVVLLSAHRMLRLLRRLRRLSLSCT